MDSKSRVTVVVTSAGQNWVPRGQEKCEKGKMLKQVIAAIEFDATIFPDPVDRPEMKNLLGIDPAAKEFVLGCPGAIDWLKEKAEFAIDCLAQMNETLSDGAILHVAVRCRGGFQRSVVLADQLARILHDKFPDQTILVAHLTLPLVLALRQNHFGVNLDAELTPEDVVKLI